MKPSPKYYEEILYPLQDKVLRVLSKSNTSFYLTGGTALSRGYLHHRYSDDLDFFVNQADDFKLQAEKSFDALNRVFNKKIELALTTDTFARLFVNEMDISLKVEFVNDVAYRHGEPIKTGLFYKTDTLRNILSNKIGALSRHEAKDVADIIEIAKSLSFIWKEVIAEAKMKDMWVDESEVMRIINDFPISKLDEVKWIKAYQPELVKKQIDIMLDDLFIGGDNMLFEDK